MRNILFLFFMLVLTACGTAVPTIKPYKLDIQQGNVVTSKMLLQLRPGMTKSQVRYIMGTPLIQDSFHGNRWDYFYQMREGGTVIEQRRVILDFENELLKAVRGDVVPSEGDKSNKTDAVTGTRVVEPEAKPEEKGFFDKLKFWKKDEAELAKEAEEEKLMQEKAAQEKITAQKKAEEEARRAAEDKAKETEKPVEIMLPVEEVKPQVSVEKAAEPEANKSEEKVQEVEKEATKKSFLDKLKFWKSDEPEVKEQALPAEEVKSLSGVPIIEMPEAGAPTK